MKLGTLTDDTGWWGLVRHANYVGSLTYTIGACLACGTDSVFPHTEVIILVFMLAHRCLRDEERCKEKYGSVWDEYCRVVRWRMIPGIF